MGMDPRDPCRIDVGRASMLHAETAAAHREELRQQAERAQMAALCVEEDQLQTAGSDDDERRR